MSFKRRGPLYKDIPSERGYPAQSTFSVAIVIILIVIALVPFVIVIIQGLVLLSMFSWTRFGCTKVWYHIVRLYWVFDDYQGLATLFGDLVSETPVQKNSFDP